MPYMQACISLLVFVSSVCLVQATIAPGDKLKDIKKQLKGPVDLSVFARNLIHEKPLAKDIIVQQAAFFKDTDIRNFNGSICGYVTPWNSHGYDVAKMFAKKFDYISPVWLQIRKEKDDYEMFGTNDIDANWMKSVRRKGKTKQRHIKIYPRLLFERFSVTDLLQMLRQQAEREMVYELIINSCKQHNFDGIVLEFWLQVGGRVDEKYLHTFVIEMAKALSKNNLGLILVIPPYRKDMPITFGQEQFDNLYKYIEAFSLMTYDYSSIQRPGANSPIHWMRQCVELLVPSYSAELSLKRSKILLGMNMYGYDYTPDGGHAITAPQYLNLVRHVKNRLGLDEHNLENYFEVRTDTGRHMVFYPTLYSINERIKLAKALDVGISLWELGQGLDYFYDLF